MAVLMIGATEQQKIAAMIAYAKAHPLLFDVVRKAAVADTVLMKLKDRPPGFERPASQHLVLPGGYRVAYSVEQQPPGLCSHLSISVVGRKEKGKMPSPQAIHMIAEEFGVPYPADKMWMEEFEPGEFAINLVSLFAPTKEGNA
jgi:hypothetical protein